MTHASHLDDERRRERAVSEILAMVPPGIGGKDQAERNLASLPIGDLMAMRSDLRAVIDRTETLAAATKAPPDSARREAAAAKLASGFGKLSLADDASRAAQGGSADRAR